MITQTGGKRLRLRTVLRAAAAKTRAVYDVVIVGAGILGLATARELLRRHPRLRLAILEKEPGPALHQTGRNSGVIHSGIYYAPGSLKAQLCAEGRRALIAYCEAKGIAYRRTGKLIVAIADAELPRLQTLWERGAANGIEGLEMLDAPDIRAHEPHCAGIRAIYSPVTAIVDYSAVTHAYASDVGTMGGEIHFNLGVRAIVEASGNVEIHCGSATVRARALITCGGLHADRLARMTGGSRDPQIVPFRGDYLILKPERAHLVRGNIYPVPDPAFPFLGAHFTPRVDGSVWIGPTAVFAFAREGYAFGIVNAADVLESLTYSGFIRLAVNHSGAAISELYRAFARNAYLEWLRGYIPELERSDVQPGPSGVRAQALSRDGSLVDDFVFERAGNVLHVRNAPSPAATASLAIASYIADRADADFALS